MEKIKENMENGLVADKEKLKYLALNGSQIFKVPSISIFPSPPAKSQNLISRDFKAI
jgi:hypothetical protein